MRPFSELVTQVIIPNILNPLVLLIISGAVVYFLWGVAKYVDKSGKDEDRQTGRQMMVYGIVAIFVMVSVWGLVQVLVNTFPFGGATPPAPRF